ncbi:MGS207 protein [Fusarium oxysporum f. sp. phaseoli]
MGSPSAISSHVFDKAPIYRLDEQPNEPAKTLDGLLKKNHAAHAVLRDPRLLFHNHLPHALGSSYLLGASSAKLEEIYAAEEPLLTAVDGGVVRNAIVADNWRNHLAEKKYTAAYVDYFDSEIEKNGGDWNKVVHDHLYSGKELLVNGFCGGRALVGHPYIHLAYGYEFNSKEVISEGLSLGCTEYDPAHKFLDNPPPDNSIYKTTSLEEMLTKVHKDKRFDGYSEHPGYANVYTLLGKYESELLEHWNALVVENTTTQFKEWLKTAAILAVSTVDAEGCFDFYLAHVLTVGHALRILLPLMPEDRRFTMMKQFGLFTAMMYLAQLRPSFGLEKMKPLKPDDSSWDSIYERALESKWSTDMHWPKVVRALKMVEEMRGPEDDLYKQAAARFISEFNGWTGFGLGSDAIP